MTRNDVAAVLRAAGSDVAIDAVIAAMSLTPKPVARSWKAGVNVDSARCYSRIIPWANVMHQAKQWHTGNAKDWNDKQDPIIDEHGNITELAEGQVARTVVFNNGGRYPTGDYYCRDLPFDLNLITPRWDAEKISVDWVRVETAKDGMCFEMRSPVPKFELGMPGESQPLPFNPAILRLVEPFSVLRTMDLQRINNSPITCMAEFSSMDDFTWDTPAGPPIQALCEICNAANSALWFCVPHMAGADANLMAEEIKTHLRADLPVYVEYSNEVWNGGFGQSKWVLELAKRNNGPGDNDAQKRANCYASISQCIHSGFRDVLGDRVIRVMGSQAATTGLSDRVLGTGWDCDALAIAPYFGGEYGQASAIPTVRKWSVDELLNMMELKSIPTALHRIELQKAVADKYNVRLIAYEGGQHLRTPQDEVYANDPIQDLFNAANRHPRIKELYAKYLAGWDAITGGETFCHFSACTSYGRYGRWGLTEYMDQPEEECPKLQAVKEWAEN